MLATDMTRAGSPEEKASWTFKMFDRDGSGTRAVKEISRKLSQYSENIVECAF